MGTFILVLIILVMVASLPFLFINYRNKFKEYELKKKELLAKEKELWNVVYKKNEL